MDLLVPRVNSLRKRLQRKQGRLDLLFSGSPVICLLLLAAVGSASAHSNGRGADTLSADFDEPYHIVLDAVRGVINDGKIRGTYEYRGDQDLPGADAEKSCKLFKGWDGPGEVLFKVRTRVLSPAHFVRSSDIGTVAVRYVVQQVAPTTTRLLIDAVFVEDSHHHTHASDGTVETSEFAVIAKVLKDIDLKRQQAEQEKGPADSNTPQEIQRQLEPVSNQGVQRADGQSAEVDLQKALAAETAERIALEAELQRLQAQAQGLRAIAVKQITTDGAVLKAFPYTHSVTLGQLLKGWEVIILSKSSYWYRVRVPRAGQEGWIYHLFLESAP
jgi:hypothetical protein